MSSPLPPDTRGLLVTGTHAGCGKTVACAGIAGSLRELGFRAQAVKPFSFLPKVSIRRGHEQAFFDRVVPSIEPTETFAAESAGAIGPVEWSRLMDACRKRVYPYLLESPGCMASPIRYVQDEVMDSLDLAAALQIPVLLVTAKQPDLIAQLAPMFAYLWHRDASVVGWLAVETRSPIPLPDWDREVLYLSQHYRFPYLGEIVYSPSISVEALQQGNLIRMTEMGVDLLPVQQALELLVPG